MAEQRIVTVVGKMDPGKTGRTRRIIEEVARQYPGVRDALIGFENNAQHIVQIAGGMVVAFEGTADEAEAFCAALRPHGTIQAEPWSSEEVDEFLVVHRPSDRAEARVVDTQPSARALRRKEKKKPKQYSG